MVTENESQCCRGIENVKLKMYSFEMKRGIHIDCITEHPRFYAVCLDEFSLETALLTYQQQYGNRAVADDNEKNRYVGYRQLARWCWGFLGKEVRVVLPSCAVEKIRRTFPYNNYTGFVYADE